MRVIVPSLILLVAAFIAIERAPSSVATAPSVTVSGPPAGTDMVPTFDDEFSGPTIDRRKWTLAHGPRIRGEPPLGSRTLWGNGEAEIYFDRDYLKLGVDPFSFSDGHLVIAAKPLSAMARNAVFGDLARHPELMTGMKAQPRIDYSSGAITTRDLFQQRYGYFEIRAAWSAGKGIWPAFWLLPADGSWPPEIDVVEAHGDKPGIAYQSVHSRVAPTTGLVANVTGSQQALHTYGVLWSPGTIDFYIDGTKTNSIAETADMKQPVYLLANMAIGGYWPGYPDPDPAFAATMTIDYVRVWQFRQTPPTGGH